MAKKSAHGAFMLLANMMIAATVIYQIAKIVSTTQPHGTANPYPKR